MNCYLPCLALFFLISAAWSAPITYPNQAYTFADGAVSPVPGAFNVKAIAVEGDVVLAVTRDGRIVPSGASEHWSSAIVDQLTNVVSVGLSHVQAAALTADGRVIDLEVEPRWPQPPGLTNVIALDVTGQAGDDDLDYKLAVTSDGRAVTWGHFGFPPSTNVPGLVTAAGGWSHVVGLKSDGTVVEWPQQPAIVPTLSNIVAVAAGGEHSVALRADGTVVAWGANNFGQSDVPAGLSNVVAISAAEHHTLALKSDGTLVGWGVSYFGGAVTPPANLTNVLAIASSGARNIAIAALPVPPPVIYPNQAYVFADGASSPVPGFTNIKAFAVEREIALAVTHDGRVVTSGNREHWLPNITEQLTNVVAVGLSHVQAAALTADGRIIEFEEPRWPQPPGLTNVIAFDVFGQAGDDDLDHKLAVTSDGKVVVWGSSDIPPPPDLGGVIQAAGGWGHVVALKGDGTVVAWGNNTDGQLDIPPGLHSVIAVAAGGEHNVALRADGAVVAWGNNRLGQTSVPAGLSNVVAIAAAEEHTLALKSDGTLVAWGRDYFGRSVTPPDGLSNVVSIAVSGTPNLALVRFPPSRPVLGVTARAPASGPLMVTVSGDPNKVYTVETSHDLLNWGFLRYVTNNVASTSFEVGDSAMHRFFRAK